MNCTFISRVFVALFLVASLGISHLSQNKKNVFDPSESRIEFVESLEVKTDPSLDFDLVFRSLPQLKVLSKVRVYSFVKEIRRLSRTDVPKYRNSDLSPPRA